MLTETIESTLHLAKYEALDDGRVHGEIPGLQGVTAEAEDLDSCHDALEIALEDWLILDLRLAQLSADT